MRCATSGKIAAVRSLNCTEISEPYGNRASAYTSTAGKPQRCVAVRPAKWTQHSDAKTSRLRRRSRDQRRLRLPIIGDVGADSAALMIYHTPVPAYCTRSVLPSTLTIQNRFKTSLRTTTPQIHSAPNSVRKLMASHSPQWAAFVRKDEPSCIHGKLRIAVGENHVCPMPA
jgi:hypothetical protein